MKDKFIIRGGQKRYEIIDFLKGFSIITIVIMHLIQKYIETCPHIMKKALSLGGTGVHVFFLCSGFGLYLTYMRRPLKYLTFIKRRFLKVYIPYIAVVIISAMIPFMYEGNHFEALLSHVFLYKMFVPEFESSLGEQLWFVSTIFQFYLLFIPLCKIKQRMSDKKFLVFSFLISIFWWIITAGLGISEERIWGSFFLQYLWEFSLGMLLAQRLFEGKDIYIKKSVLVVISVLGIGIASVATLRGGYFKTFNDFFALSGYAAIAILIYSLNMLWFKRCIMFVSKISYEIYLLHILVFEIVFYLTDVSEISEWGLGIIATLLVILFAYLYHIVLEKVTRN